MKWRLGSVLQYNNIVLYISFLQKYKATNGEFSDDILSLNMAPKLLSLDCVNITISKENTGTTFVASVTSVLNATLPTGHIKQDRYVWFTD